MDKEEEKQNKIKYSAILKCHINVKKKRKERKKKADTKTATSKWESETTTAATIIQRDCTFLNGCRSISASRIHYHLQNPQPVDTNLQRSPYTPTQSIFDIFFSISTKPIVHSEKKQSLSAWPTHFFFTLDKVKKKKKNNYTKKLQQQGKQK